MDNHEAYMRIALEEAIKANELLEVPIGAIIVKNDEIIGRGYNLRETSKSPLAHAELLAIDEAAKKLDGWRLSGATMYVTLEPCPMCAGAIYQSRISTLVYGADDPKAGSVNSLYSILSDSRLNHQVEVISGVLAEESSNLLKEFFRKLRKK